MRLNQDLIADILSIPEFDVESLLLEIKKIPIVEKYYLMSVGDWLGLTLQCHTRFVLQQFVKYFKHFPFSENFNRSDFILMLAFHDIGKPLAIVHGDKWKQHEYTVSILKEIQYDLAVSVQTLTEWICFLNGDPLGCYLRGRFNLEQSVEQFQMMVQNSNLEKKQFLNYLTVYYQVDAGAYTQDAGWKQVLDHLFEYQSSSGSFKYSKEKNRLLFSPDYEKRYESFYSSCISL